MKNKHIVSLHGSYFTNNYGDVLLVNLFFDWIREAFPSIIINLPLVDKKKIKEMPEPSLTGIVNLIKSDCLVYCGGGYFGEQPGNRFKWSLRNFYRHGIVGILAILFHIPIAIIGVEIGPISASWFRNIVLWIVKKSKVVVVRNKESYDYLQHYGVNNVILSADAVLTLSQSIQQEQVFVNNSIYHESIVLHLPGYINHKEEMTFFIYSLCNSLLSINYKNRLIVIEDIPHQYNVDYQHLFHIFDQKGIDYCIMKYSGTKPLIDIIKTSYAVFTTKLHVGITAAAFNKKVFSIYTHPKTLRFHNQIKNDAYCISLSRIMEYVGLEDIITMFLLSDCRPLPSSAVSLALKCKSELTSFISSCLH